MTFKFRKENIPNYLTLFRILLVPVYVAVFFSSIPEAMAAAGVIFIVASVTDILDGYLARKNGWTSKLGQVLDPLADKLMTMTVLICLYIKHRIIIWIVVIIVLKELLMIFGAAFILKKSNVYVKSSWYGKLATVSMFILIFIATFITALDERIMTVLCWVVIGIMLMAFVLYIVEYRAAIKKSTGRKS